METTICFGELENLLGVYRSSDHKIAHSTAIIMLTPGMLHHVGPMGLHVQLARSLSQNGVASFRFDLSGIGESLAVGSQGTSLARAQQEVAEAMDWLRDQYGFEQFILFGLCSGADDALATATNDRRVVGLSLLDGCGYRTSRFYWHWWRRKYLPKLLSPLKWQQGIVKWLRPQTSIRSMPIGFDIREYPERTVAEQQIAGLIDRGARLQFIYTGGAIDYYSYAGQFYDMFPSLSREAAIALEYIPQADHLLTLHADRERTIPLLTEWMTNVVNQLEPAKKSVVRHEHELEAVCS